MEQELVEENNANGPNQNNGLKNIHLLKKMSLSCEMMVKDSIPVLSGGICTTH